MVFNAFSLPPVLAFKKASTRPPYGEYCFLCLRTFSDVVKKTGEHVIPQWVLRMFELHTDLASLPNGLPLNYSKRQVPCCQECNGWLSKELEEPVRNYVSGKSPDIDEGTLLLWMIKIYYGTRFRELGIKIDPANSSAGYIRTEESADKYLEHLRLALLAGPDRLTSSQPLGSVVEYQSGTPESKKEQFDFYVTADGDVLAIRLGSQVFLAAIGECGVVGEHLDSSGFNADVTSLVLHPLQVMEVAAIWSATFRCMDQAWKIYGESQDEQIPGEFSLHLEFEPDVPAHERPDFEQSRVEGIKRQLIGKWPIEELATSLDDVPEGYSKSLLFTGADRQPIQVDCYELFCPAFLGGFGLIREAPCESCGAKG